VLATLSNQIVSFIGGFEPFGREFVVGPQSAQSGGVFLRLPGQWEDQSWVGVSGSRYNNVFRWYGASIGRYDRLDPDDATAGYAYVRARPLAAIDPLGLYYIDASATTQLTFGSPKYHAQRVDAEFSCACRGSGAWELKFSVTVKGTFRRPPRPRDCTVTLETTHQNIHLGWAHSHADASLRGPESASYPSEKACRNAGEAALSSYYQRLQNDESAHTSAQAWFDARAFFPEIVTCFVLGR
jgi:RHS repeat-associated protein